MIEVQCSNCNVNLQIADQYAGKAGKCKHCGGAVHVPATKREYVDPPSPPEPPPADIPEASVTGPKPTSTMRRAFGVLLIFLAILLLGGHFYELANPTPRSQPFGIAGYTVIFFLVFLGVGLMVRIRRTIRIPVTCICLVTIGFTGWAQYSQGPSLEVAIRTGDIDTVREILESRLDLVHDPYIEPLHTAISAEQADIVELLWSMGADINSKLEYLGDDAATLDLLMTNQDRTPLMNAVMERNLRIVRFLLEKGADANATSRRAGMHEDLSQTSDIAPLDFAHMAQYEEIMEILKEWGAEFSPFYKEHLKEREREAEAIRTLSVTPEERQREMDELTDRLTRPRK